MQCLWCKHPTSANEPEEHIIPESLGCPHDRILRHGEVCGRCNNRNAGIDQSLVNDFDLMRFFSGIPNKRGELPKVVGRANAGASMSKVRRTC